MTLPENSPVSRTTLLRAATITWLILISAAVVINHVSLSKLVDHSAEKASTSSVTELNERVAELTAWVEEQDQQQSIALPITRYESERQSLDQRLNTLEQTLNQHVTTQEAQDLQRRIELLEARPTAPQPLPKVSAQPRKPALPTKPVEPPFQVTGIEQRGDEYFLSLLPIGSTSLAQAHLLLPGEMEAGWKLNAIEDDNAVFQNGTHVRRLVIPQQQVRP